MKHTRTLLCLALVGCVGCNEPLDFNRVQEPRESFGAELHRILHKDVARSPGNAEEKADAFTALRDDFVEAVDTTVPADDLSDVDALLVRMMPLYDNQLLPDLLRKLAIGLDEASESPELMAAFERSEQLPTLTSHPQRTGFVLHALSYEDSALGTGMADLNDLLIATVLENSAENGAFTEIIRALAREMRLSEVEGGDRRLERILMRVLLSEDPAFAPTASYDPIYAVRLDARGLPSIAATDIGTIPFPFADEDNDGLADVNGERQYVDFEGNVFAATPFGAPGGDVGRLVRDGDGRLQNFEKDGFAFDYVDLHATVLGLLMRDTGELAAQDVPFELVTALETGLGAPKDNSDSEGDFKAYPSDNPLTRLAVGGLVALDHPSVPGLLEGSAALLRDDPEALAGVLLAMDKVSEEMDLHPNTFSEDSNLLDELLPILLEIAETPGLLEDVLLALEDPVSAKTGEALATMMRYRNDFITVTPGGAYDACFQDCADEGGRGFARGTVERFECIRACPNSEIFAEEVERNAPESASNRSLFERSLGLIWESAGIPYGVGVTEMEALGLDQTGLALQIGDMLYFEDIGETFIKSIAGDLTMSDSINPALLSGDLFNAMVAVGDLFGLNLDATSLSTLVLYITNEGLGLEMDEAPTPDQLTRFFNKDPLEVRDSSTTIVMNQAICRSGRRCLDAHADALFALEASGAVDTLYPLAVAFSKHDQADLFVQLLAVVYSHYPAENVTYSDANGVPLPLAKDDIRSLEPGIIAVLEKDLLLTPLNTFGAASNDIELEDGSSFASALEGFLAYALTPDDTLTFLDGSGSTFDPQGNEIRPISPMYLLLEPLRDLDARFDADPAGKEAWDNAVGAITDLLLSVEDDGAGGARFARAASPLLAAIVVDELRDLWLDAEAKGTRSQKLRVEMPGDIQDLIAGRVLYNTLALFEWMENRPGTKDLMRSSTLYLLEHDRGVAEQATVAVYGLLAGMQDEAASVASLQLFGRLLNPDRLWNVSDPEVIGVAVHTDVPLLTHGVMLLDQSREYDPDLLLIQVLRQGLDPSFRPDGTTPMGAVWEAIRQVHRTQPGAEARLMAADFELILSVTVDYLRDDKRGAERLYGFVERAMWGPGGKPEAAEP